MRIFTAILIVMCMLITTAMTSKDATGAGELSGKGQAGYVQDEVLVKFQDGTSAEKVVSIKGKHSLSTVKSFNDPNLYLMKINDGTPVPDVIQALSAYPEVSYAEPNYIVTIDSPNTKGIQ